MPVGLTSYPSRRVHVLVGLLIFGAAIEIAQSVSGWRYGDPLDWVADAVGVLAGLLALTPALSRKRERETDASLLPLPQAREGAKAVGRLPEFMARWPHDPRIGLIAWTVCSPTRAGLRSSGSATPCLST